MVARALLPIGLATRSSIVLPAVCTTRLVARALRLWRPTRSSIVCCQQCAAVSACFFAAVSCVACKLFAAPDAAHYQPACEPFFAALRVLHAVLSRVLVKSSSSAKPDTKWPPPRARPRVRAVFRSRALRWTGRFSRAGVIAVPHRHRTSTASGNTSAATFDTQHSLL